MNRALPGLVAALALGCFTAEPAPMDTTVVVEHTQTPSQPPPQQPQQVVIEQAEPQPQQVFVDPAPAPQQPVVVQAQPQPQPQQPRIVQNTPTGPRVIQANTGGGAQCTNTCRYANDGECDDGRPGSHTSLCSYGSDCNDCGVGGAPMTGGACMNTCRYANDGECDDGRPGSHTSLCS
ncbi:MAG TPA: hypothetical protein RMH85_28040, partial [Polyangiaceae bacterium LLY-WYZ-15_(1-7)]|nr:hypothetical protein [Polyangiaceae bacterium LLY-WYZ-15_(1-7)]